MIRLFERQALLALGLVMGIFVGSHFFPLSKNDSDSYVEAPESNLHLVAAARGPFHLLPEIPTGPVTDLYVYHQTTDANFVLAYDSTETLRRNFDNDAHLTRFLQASLEVGNRVNEWKQQVQRFRRYLAERRLLTYGADKDSVGPFLNALDLSNIQLDSLTPLGSAMMCPCRLEDRPVVNMALVIPVNMEKYRATWTLLESLRQQTVFPREIVFVVGNAAAREPNHLTTLITLIRDYYGPDLPKLTRVKLFVDSAPATPGDARWFGFNQTSADIVSLFDNDDYLHPQFFHVFWRIFRNRPELDYSLMQYESAQNEECSVDVFFPLIADFLSRRVFTEPVVETVESYPDTKYEELWGLIPTFNKTWWLGNTDAEPFWENPDQQWFDMGCHNGWTTFRRFVMEMIHPPTRKFGGEDAIYNYRVGRSKLNYRCLEMVVGAYLKTPCPMPYEE